MTLSRRRLNLAALAVLAAGLALALLVHALSDDAPPPSASYAIVDGEAHAIPAHASRRYVSQLERFGGKAAVLFDEWIDWMASLAHGRRLAWTIGVLSVLAALGLHAFALYFTPPDAPPQD